MRRILTCGVALSLTSLVAVWILTRYGDPNRVPSDFDVSAIATAVSGDADPHPTWILAWKVTRKTSVTGPSQYCLVLVEVGGEKPWVVANVHRLGQWAGAVGDWEVSQTHLGPRPMPGGGPLLCGGVIFHHAQHFDHRPTNRDIDDILTHGRVNWSFDIEAGEDVADWGVCGKNWRDAIGEPPTVFFRDKSNQGWLGWLRSKWPATFGGVTP